MELAELVETYTQPTLLTYQPKGGACMTCKHKDENCSTLPFAEMPVIAATAGVKIVKCTYREIA